MSKRVDTSGLNAGFIIGQADRSNREQKPDPVPPQTVEPVATEIEPVTVPVVSPPATEPEYEPEPLREVKESPKRRRAQAAGYKETFLKRNEMKTRQCVYISYDVHALIAKLVRTLVSAGSDISVGGYIDTVLAEHLQANKEDINEIYRRQQGDLL
ncbi:hypothetical protein EZS27_030828 [termite gut metagenome]|uniref:DUF3408 domain-containing protein n=1 Tax=termite gut metagenome TaxID=433724 RepID=A0A5J4QE86_9ZZZZ